MSDLLAARSQMAMSLAFHIIFAVVGIGMPVLMVIAERRWQKTGDGKRPMYIRLKSGKPFGFAGLYEVWEPPEGGALTTCTIITTEANELMKPIHDRMPVIVPKEKRDLWLDPVMKDQESLLDLLKPYPALDLEAYPVSRRVNSPANNFPDCIKPAAR